MKKPSDTNAIGRLLAPLNRIFQRIPDDALLLFSRFAPAVVFFLSGRTKVNGLALNDTAVFLFEEEYKLPLIDPTLAAYLAAIAEHVLPILLILGLASRLSAVALLGMTAVIQLLVYPDAWPTHGLWAALLLWVIARGPGRLSLDHLFGFDRRN